MTVSEFTLPSRDLEDEKKHRRDIADAVRRLMLGKSNNVLDATMDANSATTTVTDSRIGVYSVPICIPTTANAQAITMPYRSDMLNGSMVLNHANNADADKTFKIVLIG